MAELLGTVFTELAAVLAAETLKSSRSLASAVRSPVETQYVHERLGLSLLTLVIVYKSRLCQSIRLSNFLHSCLHCERPARLKNLLIWCFASC